MFHDAIGVVEPCRLMKKGSSCRVLSDKDFGRFVLHCIKKEFVAELFSGHVYRGDVALLVWLKKRKVLVSDDLDERFYVVTYARWPAIREEMQRRPAVVIFHFLLRRCRDCSSNGNKG